MSQNQPISSLSLILPPRTSLTQTLPFRTNSMQIFVQTPTDKTIELNVLPSDTVKELKQKIQDRDKCSFYGISFKGNKLDFRSRLSDMGIENGCTCCCYIQILFKIPTGEILELDALPSDMILGLERKIRVIIRSSFYSISFEDNELNHGSRLSNVGIKNGSTLCCFITIFVKNFVGKTVTLQTNPFNTVECVKHQMNDCKSIPLDQQRMFLLANN
ncbi:putative polyubiquitin [Gigaspora margarita]|uniref:Putative polyubiquitin n=1 Tax=Gigaspora margarita TaxID=4874 RepID=A0A8H4B5N0_GIGMA|nr:putative polyubiquitin [Gigaspora margarita]